MKSHFNNQANLPTSKTLPQSSWVAFQLIAAEMTKVVQQSQDSKDQFKTRTGCTSESAITDCKYVISAILEDDPQSYRLHSRIETIKQFSGSGYYSPAYDLLQAWLEIRGDEKRKEEERVKAAKREASIRKQHHVMYGLGARIHVPGGEPGSWNESEENRKRCAVDVQEQLLA